MNAQCSAVRKGTSTMVSCKVTLHEGDRFQLSISAADMAARQWPSQEGSNRQMEGVVAQREGGEGGVKGGNVETEGSGCWHHVREACSIEALLFFSVIC